MSGAERIFVVPWNDDPARSLAAVQALYPHDEILTVDKRSLRESALAQQVNQLRQLRGKAVVFCFRSLNDLNAPILLPWIGLLHRCPVTVLLDDSGNKKIYGRWSWLPLLPLTAGAMFVDAGVLLLSFIKLNVALLRRPTAVSLNCAVAGAPLAYLFPHPLLRSAVGGAMSHIRGFLGGLYEAGIKCDVYTAQSLPQDYFVEQRVGLSSRTFLFWEAMAIAYNWRFARAVRKSLESQRPVALYHRHGRFAISGALLSRKLKVPLVLEYNGSEVWLARNWDPARFRLWLRLCEDYSLKSAALIVVVSEPLRKDLVSRGIPQEKILVNPNAADPVAFQPGKGGGEVRTELGIAAEDVVVCFVGTFSYWHGISVLQEAMRCLLEKTVDHASRSSLRFLLIGDGPLRAEVAAHLGPWVKSGQVIFTGLIAHDAVARYMDAADIFVSPHTPMQDGSQFFGSPTKVFEYMAMAKPIIASRLGQMEEIFTHGDTGWLVTPGSVDALVAAVLYLAGRPEVRASLGKRAREAVLAQHTWKQNAEAVWDHLAILGWVDHRNPAVRSAAEESREVAKSVR
jgi:glycosyltransferase involved in cell wall biosynthesis